MLLIHIFYLLELDISVGNFLNHQSTDEIISNFTGMWLFNKLKFKMCADDFPTSDNE